MRQTPLLRNSASTDVGPAFRAHLVTAWLVFGGYLLYCVLFLPPENLAHLCELGTLLLSAVGLFLLPLLMIMGCIALVAFNLEQPRFGVTLACIAAMLAYCLLWRGVWWLMYGRN